MAELWHRCLGHMSEKGMEVLRKEDLLSNLKSSKLDFCEHCVFGKHKQSAFGIGIHRSTNVLEYADSDVWGNLQFPHILERSTMSLSSMTTRDTCGCIFYTIGQIIEGGEKAQAPDIDKGESHPSRVEGEIIHDINHDTPPGDIPMVAEDVLESEEHVEEQEGVGRPVGRPPNDDQPESSMRRSSRVKGALERYGVWFPSDQVDEHDNEGDVVMLWTG
ncbi:hypothetical protein R1flu_011427 [Riccia fluitans]|uniref:GAG-pre-integrase domain-containing protein n=1 Tax=Riccia fluitans TaxID=41844 RepID=A0ABD1Z806_9MARC